MINYIKKYLNILNLKTEKNKKYDIVGQVAIAQTVITSSFGVITLIEEDKNIICRSYGPIIGKGERVLICGYSQSVESYFVDTYPEIK